MDRYGVFKRFANGSFLYVSSAEDLPQAKAKMLAFAHESGREHSVYDFELSEAIASCLKN